MRRGVRSFHDYVQLVWGLHNCPACFIKQYLHHIRSFSCMKCNFPKSLHFCLSCGHVGCSRRRSGHYREHYFETGHSLSVKLDNFNVWDHDLQCWSHDMLVVDDDCDTFSLNIPKHFYSRCFCYICLYKRTPRLLKYCVCMECNVTETRYLWLCMICGHVGCGTESKSHALQHYTTSGHPVVSQLDNLTAWSYILYKHIKQIWHVPDSLPVRNRGDADNDEEKLVVPIVKPETFVDEQAPLLESPPQGHPSAALADELKLQHKLLISRVNALELEKLMFEEKLAEHERRSEEYIMNIMNRQFSTPRKGRSRAPAIVDSPRRLTKRRDICEILNITFIIISSVSLLVLFQYFFLNVIENLAKIV